jgi:hypothetical protein
MPDDQMTSARPGLDTALREMVPPVLMALGAFTLLRTSRLLSLAVLGYWAYDVATSTDRSRVSRGRDIAAKRAAHQAVDAEIEDSFPASDPPSFSGSTAGAP